MTRATEAITLHLDAVTADGSSSLAGVLLGWLQLASQSVVPPTIAHGALNVVAPLPIICSLT